jgi:hypothetical protein
MQGLSETALVLRTQGADLTLATPGILRISRQEHHIRNGMLIGFASGLQPAWPLTACCAGGRSAVAPGRGADSSLPGS